MDGACSSETSVGCQRNAWRYTSNYRIMQKDLDQIILLLATLNTKSKHARSCKWISTPIFNFAMDDLAALLIGVLVDATRQNSRGKFG
jgi:hypothetical protein